MTRRLRSAGPLLLALLAACSEARRAAESGGAVGAPAPEYSAMSLGGDSVTLASRRGSVVLLNVWATWCAPCRAEIPELSALQRAYAKRGLEIVGVSVDADGAGADVRAFMRELAMNYTVWLDPADRISTQFLMIGVPTTFVIDKAGVVRWRKTGPVLSRDTGLVAAIERALGN